MSSTLLRRLGLSAFVLTLIGVGFLQITPHAGAATVPGPKKFERITSYAHKAARASVSQAPMAYHGGVDGVAVNVGAPKVYVVFWGSQWGQASRSAAGWLRFSNDPAHMAPVIQRLYAGLGTAGEGWSTVLSQYCQAPGLQNGATSCNNVAGAQHIPVPTNGALADVWYDNTTRQPSRRATCTNGGAHQCTTGPTGNSLAAEALRAELHFGLNSDAALRNVQIVIASPPGTHPDGFDLTLLNASSDFCAWHDYTGSAAYTKAQTNHPGTRTVAFTNLPYIPDAGSACGANYVNSVKDGVTIVASHEYAETITDQYPEYYYGGWFDDGATGNEVADACSWGADVGAGGAGAGLVTLATGTFALEANWSNAADHCVLEAP